MKYFALIAFLLFSCAGGPKNDSLSSGEDQPVANTRPAAEASAAEQEKAEEQPVPVTLLPAEQPEETFIIEELPEPEIDLADVVIFTPPPRETVAAASLPEPELPVLPPVPEPVVVPAPAPAAQTPPAPVPAPVQPTPAPAPPPRPPEMRPPAFLGPAEERPPVTVTETVPSPVFPAQETVARSALPRESLSEQIVFSRTVRATVGQIVEIPFRGTGWVYLGELASRRGIVYDSRRLDPEGQTFIFRVEESGTYALKFYKQDFIRDFILNDYVQVIAGEAPTTAGSGWFSQPLDRGRVIAEPRWPTSLEEAELRRSAETTAGAPSSSSANAPASAPPPAGRTITPVDIAASAPADAPRVTAPPPAPLAEQTGAGESSPAEDVQPLAIAPAVPEQPETTLSATEIPLIPANSPPDAYLSKAKELFDGGNAASAIGVLNQFREKYPSGSDEAYWLYGQFYEANTPSRDILTSLDYYRRLVREYPQSGRLNDARRRIAYLERYYINIQ